MDLVTGCAVFCQIDPVDPNRIQENEMNWLDCQKNPLISIPRCHVTTATSSKAAGSPGCSADVVVKVRRSFGWNCTRTFCERA